MGSYSGSPVEALRSAWSNRKLIAMLTKREILGRYQGSVLGGLWSLINPILLLGVYTFVFSVVFQTRWSGGEGSKAEFALLLFSGLIVFNMFSEVVNRAPSLVLSNANYVKKVVFPLEILSVVSLSCALFHAVISLLVWLVFYSVFISSPPLTILLVPVMLMPLVLISLGAGWLLSSIGVFFRDVSQVIGVLVTTLLFMSPVFYPVSALPETYQIILYFNPLTLSIEFMRGVMVQGEVPNLVRFFFYFLESLFFSMIGFAWFQKTRKGFADVL
nr:ABC transporter permease [Pseudomonas sp. FFPRI_1]